MSNHNYLFFLLLASIFCGISTLPQRSSAKNNKKNSTALTCDHDKMDQCTLELTMIGDPNWRFPENMEQMNRRCRNVKTLEQCIKDYSGKCLHSDSRQTIQVMLYGISKTNRFYCSNKRRKAAIINTGTCANTFIKDMNNIMFDIIRKLHAIRFYPDNKMKIPLTCW